MIVSVTGHRPNRLAIGNERLSARLDEAFALLKPAALGAHPVAISALAEGADRLFAHAALNHGFALHALLPFSSADYETTFGDASTTPDYRSLLAAAAHVDILPGTLADDTQAYEAVGHALVDRCTLLIAVWDGQPAAGRGGTPDIIAYALAQKRPTIWIDAREDVAPRELLTIAPSIGSRALKRLPLSN